MISPCESVVKYFLPAMKAGIAKQLYAKYGFSQVQIAHALGLTQAQVSNYLSHGYSKDIDKAAKLEPIREQTAVIAKLIAKNGIGASEISRHVCTTCAKVNAEYDCMFSAAKKR